MAANDRPTDPLLRFQEFITDWERRFDAAANRVMGTEEFSRGMNSVQSLQIGMQKQFLKGMAQYLNSLNMPSRRDITRLGERLIAMEDRMARIETLLDRVVQLAEPVPAPRPGPRRTRKPPAKKAPTVAKPAAGEAAEATSQTGAQT